MTVFSIDDDGRWFDLDGGGRIQLREMTAEKHKEIKRQTVKKKIDFKKVEGTPARFDFEETNDELSNDLFWDYVIVAWEDFTDVNGQDIPCTPENKKLLMAKSPKFGKIVADCLKQLNEAIAEDAKAETKN